MKFQRFIIEKAYKNYYIIIDEKEKEGYLYMPKKRIQTVDTADQGWKGTEDLYLISNERGFDSAHQFKSQISGIYGVKEYIWTGVIPQGRIDFKHLDGRPIPVPADSNHGYTLVGKAKDLFEAENALVVLSESGDQAYVYIQPESHIKYVGDDKVHTLYVRIYDNDNGENNDRWLTLSIN